MQEYVHCCKRALPLYFLLLKQYNEVKMPDLSPLHKHCMKRRSSLATLWNAQQHFCVLQAKMSVKQCFATWPSQNKSRMCGKHCFPIRRRLRGSAVRPKSIHCTKIRSVSLAMHKPGLLHLPSLLERTEFYGWALRYQWLCKIPPVWKPYKLENSLGSK